MAIGFNGSKRNICNMLIVIAPHLKSEDVWPF